jgi:hypothetical protein
MTNPALGARTVFTGRTTNWPLIWVTTALVVPLLAMSGASWGDWHQPGFLAPVLVMFLAVLVNVLTLSSIRTAAGPHGVTVHFGVFGWPRFRYPVATIRRVEATRLTTSQWGWGMNWSPRRGLMIALRNGPAIRLELVSGRKVTIGVANADEAVAVLAAAGCPTTAETRD